MRGSSLQRAERIGRATGIRWGLVAVAGGSALLAPLLVTDLGLVLQLLIGSSSPPASVGVGLPFPSLNQVVSGERFAAGGSALLLILVAVSWVLALLDALSLIVLQRLVQRYAGRVAMELRRAIHDQTFALGPHDLMGAFRSRPRSCSQSGPTSFASGWYRGGRPSRAA